MTIEKKPLQVRRVRSKTKSATVTPTVAEVNKIDPASLLTPLAPETSVVEIPALESMLRARHGLEPENYPKIITSTIEIMETYVTLMQRGAAPTTKTQGEQAWRLFLAMTRALRDNDVIAAVDTVLWYMDKNYNNAFFSELPFRGAAHHRWASQETFNFFTKLVSLFQLLAPIMNRSKTIRTMDFGGAVGMIPDAFERERTGFASYVQYYKNPTA